MSTARKFRPGWDYASYLMRTDVEHERRPRAKPGAFTMPEPVEFNMERCLKAWRSIGMINNPNWITESMNAIQKWERSGVIRQYGINKGLGGTE